MEAVIFDLDGVVVDSEKHWNRMEEEIYSEAAGSHVDVEKYAGISISNTYSKISERFNVDISEEEFFQMYEDRAEKVYYKKAELMEGFKELVEELRNRDISIGLATGSHWPEMVIDRFELEFDSVVDASQVSGKGKPEPETYRLAVERIDANPEDSIAVDDTEPGVESANGAGLHSIGYSHPGGTPPSNADETVRGPEKLRSRLLELSNK